MKTPDPSHKMSKWQTDVRAPAGTPRFYSVSSCKLCGAEMIKHPAGERMDDDLTRLCLVSEEKVVKKPKKKRAPRAKHSNPTLHRVWQILGSALFEVEQTAADYEKRGLPINARIHRRTAACLRDLRKEYSRGNKVQ